MAEDKKRSTGYHQGSVDTVISVEAVNEQAQAIAQGGEHSTQQQQRQDQQPARHSLVRRRSVSACAVQLKRLASARGSNTVIFLRSICTRPALRRSPSSRVIVTRVEPIASAIA